MGPNLILDKGMVATTAIPLYHVVKQTDVEDCAVADTAGEDWIGVCQEQVDADEIGLGRVVSVRLLGITRAVADAAIDLRDRVAATATGTVATAAAGQEVVGICLTPATEAGEWVDILLTHNARNNAV